MRNHRPKCTKWELWHNTAGNDLYGPWLMGMVVLVSMDNYWLLGHVWYLAVIKMIAI